MNLCGCSDECIHRVNGSAERLATGNEPPPLIRNRAIYAYDPFLEALWQIIAQPLIETTAPGASGQALDAVPQLRKRHDAEEDVILIHVGEPVDETCVGPRLRPL